MPSRDRHRSSGARWCFPLLLTIGLLWLAACSVPSRVSSQSPAVSGERFTGVTGGVVDSSGSGVANAWIYAYRSDRSGLRGPADFAIRTEPDGHYLFDLPEGSYWLVARLRHGGDDAGPPQAGDSWAPYVGNPVVVTAGEGVVADFRLQVIASPQLLRLGSQVEGETGFVGRLVDGDGRPVEGGFAFVHRAAGETGMPDFTSQAVGGDGRFRLFVDSGGHFCLAARTRTRGQPQPGELFGRFDNAREGCLELESGSVLDVGDLVLRPFRQ